jgi:tripeptidyl-peptidase-1
VQPFAFILQFKFVKMKTTLFAAVATVLLVTSSAVPTPSNHVLHEKRTSLPRSWVRSDRVEREAILPVRVGLVQNNLHIGEDLLMEV